MKTLRNKDVTFGTERHPEKFTVTNVSGPQILANLQRTVATPDDFAIEVTVYATLYLPLPTLDDQGMFPCLVSTRSSISIRIMV